MSAGGSPDVAVPSGGPPGRVTNQKSYRKGCDEGPRSDMSEKWPSNSDQTNGLLMTTLINMTSAGWLVWIGLACLATVKGLLALGAERARRRTYRAVLAVMPPGGVLIDTGLRGRTLVVLAGSGGRPRLVGAGDPHGRAGGQ